MLRTPRRVLRNFITDRAIGAAPRQPALTASVEPRPHASHVVDEHVLDEPRPRSSRPRSSRPRSSRPRSSRPTLRARIRLAVWSLFGLCLVLYLHLHPWKRVADSPTAAIDRRREPHGAWNQRADHRRAQLVHPDHACFCRLKISGSVRRRPRRVGQLSFKPHVFGSSRLGRLAFPAAATHNFLRFLTYSQKTSKRTIGCGASHLRPQHVGVGSGRARVLEFSGVPDNL